MLVELHLLEADEMLQRRLEAEEMVLLEAAPHEVDDDDVSCRYGTSISIGTAKPGVQR